MTHDINIKRLRGAIMQYRTTLGATGVSVYLSPSDLAALTPEERQTLTAGGGVRLVADEDTNPGGWSVGRDRSPNGREG